jgi:hypothetical protein
VVEGVEEQRLVALDGAGEAYERLKLSEGSFDFDDDVELLDGEQDGPNDEGCDNRATQVRPVGDYLLGLRPVGSKRAARPRRSTGFRRCRSSVARLG